MDPSETIALGAAWYVVFLLSITCHEGAHALVAMWGGDLTAFESGQVTLNPVPHIQRELVGTVVVPILSYAIGGWMIGWASAPYDPFWAERHPRRAGWMALAGPTANLLLVLLAGVALRAGLWAGVFTAPESVNFTRVVEATQEGTWPALAVVLSIVFALNLLLFLFNLLPVPPLDGNSAITLLMSEPTGRRFREFTQSWGLIGLLLAWYVFGYLFRPAFIVALNLLHPGANYG